MNGASDVVADKGLGLNTRSIPIRTCIGWAIGSVGAVALLGTVNSLILKYVVDNLGLTAAMAGAIITATRLFDASLDPFMGTLSDRTRHKWGRRRPYLLLGSILCALSAILIFSDPFSIAQAHSTAYVIAALMFFSIAYTVFNVPYLTMSYELTTTPKDRTYLMSTRVYFMSAGAILGGSLGPWIVSYYGGGMTGYAMMGYFLSIVIFLTCFSSFLFTKGGRVAEVSSKSPKPSLKEALQTFKNKPFVCLIGAKSAYLFGTGINSACLAFFVAQILDRELSILGLIGAGIMGSVILSQPFWVYIIGLVGKRRCFIIAAPLNAIGNLSWLLADASEPTWLIVARACFIGLAAGGMSLSVQAMLPETLAHEGERSSVPQEGVMAGVFTTIERGVSALGVAVAGLILSVGGYVSDSSGTLTQSDGAIYAIYFCTAVIPALSMIAAIGFIWRYHLKG